MADEVAVLLVLGRLLLGGLFLFAGIRHFWLLDPLTGLLASRGVPAPRLALIAGSVWEGVFGALLVLGIAVPLAALALVGFTIVATALFLNFWSMEGQQREIALNGALTNVGVVGGLLIAAAAG
jgi:putative oxidoreductase